MNLRLLAILGVAILAFSSCDAFFSTNLFKEAGMGQQSAADIASMSSADLAKDATSSGPDSTFYQVLTNDPATKTAVLATLADTYTTSPDPAAVQAAAAAAAKIELVTTGADALMNNLLPVLGSLPAGGFASMTSANVVSALDALVPPALLSNQTAFMSAMQAFTDSKAALDALGASVGTGLAVEKSVVGSAAQAGMVGWVLGAINLSTVNDPGTGLPYASAPALLWAMLDPTASPASKPDTSSLQLIAGYKPTDDANLNNLLVASGLPLSTFGM